MAFKGTAGKSSSGASMSKYDVEVEARLKALEKDAHPVPTGATQQKIEERLSALEAKCGSSGGGDCAALEAKVDKVIKVLHSLTDFDI